MDTDEATNTLAQNFTGPSLALDSMSDVIRAAIGLICAKISLFGSTSALVPNRCRQIWKRVKRTVANMHIRYEDRHVCGSMMLTQLT